MADTSPYLAWWTSIETDLRKSLLVGAGRDRERLHDLVRTAFEAGQSSATTPSPSTPPEDTHPAFQAAMKAAGHRFDRRDNGAYKGMTEYRWEGWVAALASRPAKVDDEPPQWWHELQASAEALEDAGAPLNAASVRAIAEKFRQGQRDAVAADRARRGEVDDMAMLIRQLAQSLGKANPNSELPARAVDYLKRKDLLGSPLRAAPSHTTNKEKGDADGHVLDR